MAKNPPNSLNESGAGVLARRIREYWAERGYHVHTWTERVSVVRQDGVSITSDMFAVRSDMVNGMPIGHALKAAA